MRHLLYLRRSALGPGADALAAACGVSRADADRVLKSKTPQAIRVEESPEAAEAAVASLRERGIDAFAVSRDELRAFRPRAVEVVRPPTTLYEKGTAIDVPDVRTIVTGRILSERKMTTRTDTGAGAMVGAGLIAGAPGIMARVVSGESSLSSRDEESFACLFRESGEAFVVMEASFNYRGTLDRIEPVRERSFLRVVEIARAAWPAARFDDRLYRWPPAARTSRETRASAGFLVDTTHQIDAGSNAERAMAMALVIHRGG